VSFSWLYDATVKTFSFGKITKGLFLLALPNKVECKRIQNQVFGVFDNQETIKILNGKKKNRDKWKKKLTLDAA
jgi:hypothetical protein